MAILATVPARNINGVFTSPSTTLPVRITPGRYRLVIVWEDATQIVNPARSWDVRWEWQDSNGDWITGGGCGQNGKVGLTQTEYSCASWHVQPDGTIVDLANGRPVRIVAQSPGPQYPGTSGTVRLSARLEDYD